MIANANNIRLTFISKFCGSVRLVELLRYIDGMEFFIMDYPKCCHCNDYKRCSLNIDSRVLNRVNSELGLRPKGVVLE